MPERMYPGLGTPIESGLPFDVGPGTRAAGMQMLSRAMEPDAGHVPSIGEVLFGMNPFSFQQKMAEQRDKMMQDYYSVPPDVPLRAEFDDRVRHALNEGLGKPKPLGPSASGRAEPALLTDEMVANYGAARFAGRAFPWVFSRTNPKTGAPEADVSTFPPGPVEMRRGGPKYPSFGMIPGGGNIKQLPSTVEGEKEKRGMGETLRGQPYFPGPEDVNAKHVIQGFNPPEGYPMPTLKNYYGPFAF